MRALFRIFRLERFLILAAAALVAVVIWAGIHGSKRHQIIDLQGKAEMFLIASQSVADVDRFHLAVKRAQLNEDGAERRLNSAMNRLRTRMENISGDTILAEPNEAVNGYLDRARQKLGDIETIMAIKGCDLDCRSTRLFTTLGELRFTLVRLRTKGAEYVAEAHSRAAELQSYTITIIFRIAAFFAVLTLLSIFHLWRKNRSLRMQMLRAAASERRVLEISDYRARFLAGMSHELRTPLNAIKGFSQFLLMPDTNLPQDVRMGYLADIEKSAVDLEGLMDGVLDLAKIDAGTFEIYREQVDLVELANEVAHQFSNQNRRLRLDIPDALSAYVDRLSIKRCLQNLTSNALKFSEGAVTLTMTEEDKEFVLRVTDTGMGMSAEEVRDVWLPYRRNAHVRHSDRQGTGLGLPITKELITLHGGKIKMRSKLGLGTSVTIHLPKSENTTAATPQAQLKVDEAATVEPRALAAAS